MLVVGAMADSACGEVTMLSRRAFLETAAASAALCVRAQEGGPLVARTAYGQVRGAPKDGVVLFKGIPYAGAPVGEYRFRPAPPLKPWSGVRDALVYGPQSMQAADPAWPKTWKAAESSEDCLYLNVWTPAPDAKRRPVMFYSHGGGFATGNGGAEVTPQNLFHDGAALARDYDVVVVTHNHRLNIMGYLYLGDLLGEEYAASGIVGMLDIVAALEWVHRNIASFGGDPDRVMIWGESGGGAKTSVLTAMPGAQGLYHRASVESGSALRMKSRDAASATARAVLTALGLRENQARQLLTMPTADLIAAMSRLPHPPPSLGRVSSGLAEGIGFAPMVDGHHLPTDPYDPVAPKISADIPMIVGTNKDETLFIFRAPDVLSMDEAGLRQRLTAMFQNNAGRILEVYQRSRPGATPAELFIAITTAQWMLRDAIAMAERKAALRAGPVYMYQFAYGSPSPAPAGVPYHSGSAHAAEIGYKFDHVPEGKNMSAAWAAFARTGNPSHSGIPVWPPYTLDRRATMILAEECHVVDDPHREERLLWESLG